MWVCSNRFRDDLPQYCGAESAALPVPTSDTMEITQAALDALGRVFRQGILYKRAGVMVGDITAIAPCQADLFDPVRNRAQRARLMKSVDALNHRYGLKTLRLAVEGGDRQPWKLKCAHRSPCYLTRLDEILTIHT